MSDLKKPEEWCHIEGVEILDPDGWRGSTGRPWTDPITLDEFKSRLITCTMRHAVGTTNRAEFDANRAAGLRARHETREARAVRRQVAEEIATVTERIAEEYQATALRHRELAGDKSTHKERMHWRTAVAFRNKADGAWAVAAAARQIGAEETPS